MQNLIVQGADIETRWLKELAQQCAASGIEQIAQQPAHAAYRLRNATRADVAAYCLERRLDFAFVPAGVKLGDLRLFVTDMDSTLITAECIDEIADMQGLKPQVAAITEAAMRGELDFAQSLTQRVALLKGLDEAALLRVYEERIRFTPGAENLLGRLKAAGVHTMLVSGGFTFYTERIRARLGFDEAHANELEIEGGALTGRVRGTIVDGEQKRAHLLAAQSKQKVATNQILTIGDGANDLPMLGAAGYGVAYRAKPVVVAQAAYALNFSPLDAVLNYFE